MTTKDKKLRIFNYRPLCACVLSIIFVLLLVKNVFFDNIYLVVVYSLCLGAVLLWLVLKKKIVCFVICLLLACLFVSYCTLTITNFADYDYNNTEVSVVGRVSRETYINGSIKIVLLDNVQIEGDEQGYTIKVSFTDYSGIFDNGDIGDIIAFNTTLRTQTLKTVNNDFDSSVLAYNTKYSCSVNMSDVTLKGKHYTFADKVRNVIKDRIFGGMGSQNASLAYSALFGDKLELPIGIRESFSASGAAHLIAVSGLHVGLVVSILAFVLNKLKAKEWLAFLLNFILIGIYAYICNFAVSVCRAWIMTTILLLAPLVRREYDSLSAISLAGIVMLAFNPFEIFNASALMSFGCVLGIAYFNKAFTRLLCKIHVPKALADSLAISISAQIGILGATLLYFRNIQLISTLTNIIVVPLFTLAFSVVFVLAFVSIILPFIKYLMWAVDPILSLVTLTCNFFSTITFANLTTNAIDYQVFMLYNVGTAVGGKYCMLKPKSKMLALTIIFTIFIVYFTIGVLV